MKKKIIEKNIKYILIIVLLGIILLIISLQNLKNKENLVDVGETINEEHYEATVIGVGDNLIHDSVYNEANKLAGYNGYDFKPIISNIKEIVKNYDIGYYNQETILGGSEIGLSSYPTFNSPYEVGEAMIDSGFNLVSLATNHTVDRGMNAVKNSCAYWNSKEKVMTAGSYCSNEEKEEVKIATVNNITYTMLNYTYGTNGIPVYDDYLVNVWPTNLDLGNPEIDIKYQAYKENVKNDIEKVRDKVDVLIVAMHWGVEYTHTPTVYEVDMANYLASLGVNVIIGTHPHVIQPVTWIDNTLVIYSLGNFLSSQYQNYSYCSYYKCTVGLMTSFKIEKDIKNDIVNIKISNVENELIYNYYNQISWDGFKIIPFSNMDIKNYLPDYQNVYEHYKNIVKSLYSEMFVKELAE